MTIRHDNIEASVMTGLVEGEAVDDQGFAGLTTS